MQITDQIESLRLDKIKDESLNKIQNVRGFQKEYENLMSQGIIKKKKYNLASIESLGNPTRFNPNL